MPMQDLDDTSQSGDTPTVYCALCAIRLKPNVKARLLLPPKTFDALYSAVFDPSVPVAVSTHICLCADCFHRMIWQIAAQGWRYSHAEARTGTPVSPEVVAVKQDAPACPERPHKRAVFTGDDRYIQLDAVLDPLKPAALCECV